MRKTRRMSHVAVIFKSSPSLPPSTATPTAWNETSMLIGVTPHVICLRNGRTDHFSFATTANWNDLLELIIHWFLSPAFRNGFEYVFSSASQENFMISISQRYRKVGESRSAWYLRLTKKQCNYLDNMIYAAMQYFLIIARISDIPSRCENSHRIYIEYFSIVSPGSAWASYFAASCNAVLPRGNHATMIAVAEMNNALSLRSRFFYVSAIQAEAKRRGALYAARPRSRFHFQRACSHRRPTVADKRLGIVLYIHS